MFLSYFALAPAGSNQARLCAQIHRILQEGGNFPKNIWKFSEKDRILHSF